MNENKFRAWDKEGACWIPQGQIAITGKGEIFSIDQQAGWLEETIEISICRYTGLKDKNGKEIYEGDIVTSTEYPFQDDGEYNYHGVIEWFKESFAFGLIYKLVNKSKAGISHNITDFLDDFTDTGLEVIGNIYENPELLEKEGK